jgi:hypothetical protein
MFVSEAKDIIWMILYSTNKLHVLANLMVTITFGFDEALPISLPCQIQSFLTHPVGTFHEIGSRVFVQVFANVLI